MKIVLLDFIFTKGHINFNSKIASILSNLGDLYTVNYERNKDLDLSNLENKISLIKVPNLERYAKGSLTSRIVYLLYMIIQRIQLIRLKPDRVIVLTFDVLVFAIGRLFYRKKEVYLFHHNNIDELKNKIKLRVFKTYMNKVNHIVFAEFIKDYLVNEIGVEAFRVSILPHPLRSDIKIDKSNPIIKNGSPRKFVGISHSNDEKFIEEIILFEEKFCVLKKNNCKLILKSKRCNYDNGYLKVGNYYYEKEEYDELFNSSTGVLLLFPENYEYRMSGTLFDAFAWNKPVVARNIKLINSLNQLYPNICSSFSSIDELIHIITEKDLFINEEEINRLREYHSDKNLKYILKRLMEAR